ncbi:hypothetical protein RV14_GL000530 [Enterococcus ratti]|uniref:Shikimate kinase n=2 Tax=Enterococcus ratti TaxID=150033 RepID=A0A1L8WIC8_9ENTE|nr:hypothetical protein RV14_GL000530 [Enterococcus ratti]
MGAGKTTISKKLAQQLGKNVLDMDEQLINRLGCSIAQYFSTAGEAAFRLQETNLLKEFLKKEGIIATGGGTILSKENQKLLKDHQVVYLKGKAEILIERIRQDQETIRPLALKNSDLELKKLLLERRKWYERLAKITIDTSKKSPEEITEEIIEQLENQGV